MCFLFQHFYVCLGGIFYGGACKIEDVFSCWIFFICIILGFGLMEIVGEDEEIMYYCITIISLLFLIACICACYFYFYDLFWYIIIIFHINCRPAFLYFLYVCL
jgi:hypothetical protein